MNLIQLDGVERLKVKSVTDTNDFKNAIIASFKRGNSQQIDVVGAGALNVAIKAVASASSELQKGPLGIKDIIVSPSWFAAQGETADHEVAQISGIRLETFYVMREQDINHL